VRFAAVEEPERLANHVGSHLGELVFRKVFAPNPPRVEHVRRGRQLAALKPAHVIDDDVVVAHPATTLEAPAALPAGVAQDAVENGDHLQRFHVETGLFLELAPRALCQFLTQFKHPARNGPLMLQRLCPAFDQQNALAVDHHPPDADQRLLGVFACHGVLHFNLTLENRNSKIGTRREVPGIPK